MIFRLACFILFLFSSFLSAKEAPKVCLTMIVKNEEKIIRRCLERVQGFIDCVSICDTGSSDKTIQEIEFFLSASGIPGKVYQHEWKNFGWNRTLSAEAAQKTLFELGFDLENTYLLFLDADLLLEVAPSFKKEDLKSDSYSIRSKSGDLSYYTLRLAKASLPWKSVSVTHEYWQCQVPARTEKLNSLYIDDRGDGGSKSDKFERDIRLLTQGIKDEPNNERYLFYLAQSYLCLGEYEKAIEWYKKRVERGGWQEEVWYSKCMIGDCYTELKRPDLALHWYLEAYEGNPDRAESFYRLAHAYRLNDKPNLAFLFAKKAAAIAYPSQQILFISDAVYQYQCDEEISIAAYYTPYREEGFKAANRLILKRGVPSHVKRLAYQNIIYYLSPLKNTKIFPIEIDLPQLSREGTRTFNPTNPSIQKTDDGYELIVRTVNFIQSGGKNYRTINEGEAIQTRNFLVRYDKEWNLLSQKEIIDEATHHNLTHVKGLEDCHLVRWNDALWFTSTTYEDNAQGIPHIVLCRLEEDDDESIVETFLPLKGPDPNRCEKNWLPFVREGKLNIIYGYEPFTIYQPNLSTGELTRDLTYSSLLDLSSFRGSAAPIPFDNGYLLLVHEVAFGQQRYYMHRFVYLDKDLIIQKMSKPFIFQHLGIEYCCGMATDHAEENLWLTISREDKEAYRCSLLIEEVKGMLESLSL